MSSCSDRLCHALLAIHSTTPKLISSPPLAGVAHTAAGFGASHVPSSASHAKQVQRRASVAIIVRIRARDQDVSLSSSPRSSTSRDPSSSGIMSKAETSPRHGPLAANAVPTQLTSFFSQKWVQNGTPEILFIKRANRASDRWSAHVAFPGGRQEEDDEGPQFTALRETWEEVGIDLCERDYVPIGQLDDREITTSLGKRLLMILSPFVYLHTGKEAPVPELQTSEVASAHWVPITHLLLPDVKWSDVSIDLGSRLAPNNAFACSILRLLVGQMHFRCILLPNKPTAAAVSEESDQLLPDLRLWGLTLGMTLDLLAHMTSHPMSDASLPAILPTPATYPFLEPTTPSTSTTSRPTRSRRNTGSSLFHTELSPSATSRAPSMASIFPRFEGIDINLWLWVFSWRYRHHMRKWDDSSFVQSDKRVNWAGVAVSRFYSALRRALVVSILIRGIVLCGGISTVIAWAYRKCHKPRNLIH